MRYEDNIFRRLVRCLDWRIFRPEKPRALCVRHSVLRAEIRDGKGVKKSFDYSWRRISCVPETLPRRGIVVYRKYVSEDFVKAMQDQLREATFKAMIASDRALIDSMKHARWTFRA